MMKEKLVILGEHVTTQLQNKIEFIKNSSSLDSYTISLLEMSRKEIADFVFFIKQAITTHPFITHEVYDNFKQKADEIVAAINEIR